VADTVDRLHGPDADLRSADADDLVAALEDVESARRALDAFRLALLGELDARGEPLRRTGLRTNAWLGHRFGAPRARAGREVAVARKLRAVLPRVAAALAEGRITEDHAALLTRLTTPRVESTMVALQDQLIDLAYGVRFERWAADVRALVDLADADGGHRPTPEDNRLRVVVDGNGVLHLDGRLVGEDAAVVAQHLHRAADRAFRRHVRDHQLTDGELGAARANHLAAGLVDLVRRGAGVDGTSTAPAADLTVTIPVDHPALVGRHDGPAVVDHHGHVVDGRTLDLLTCDATFTALVVDSLGTPLDLGTTVRFVDRHQRRALAARDGGCVFPGCDAPAAWTDAHHVVRVADGGTSDANNLALLCRHHHGVVHRPDWSMRHVGDQRFQVVTPAGVTLDCQRHHRPARSRE